MAEGVMHISLGNVYDLLGDPATAIRHSKAALERFRQNGLGHAEALTLCNLGVDHHDVAEFAQAADYLSQGIALLRQLGLSDIIGIAALSLASTLITLGRLEDAVQLSRSGAKDCAIRKK